MTKKILRSFKPRRLKIVKEEIDEEVEDRNQYSSPNLSIEKETSKPRSPSRAHRFSHPDRPYSGKLSISDAIEQAETLEDFEEQEREIARQLNESSDSKDDLLPPDDELETVYLPDSIHNRQSIVNIPLSMEELEGEDPEEPDQGYPLDYSGPPPAYSTSSRPESGLRKRKELDGAWPMNGSIMQQGEPSNNLPFPGEGDDIVEGYEVPSPHGFSSIEHRQESLDVGLARRDTTAGVTDPTSSSNTNKAASHLDFHSAIGSSFAFAGGMAAAVAGNNATAIARASEDDIYDYKDNIRDRPVTNTTFLGKTNSIEEAKQEVEDEGPQAKYPISDDLKNIFRLIEEFEAEKVEIETVLKPFLLDYIPAVGDVDPFIKIPRPDDVEDQLGLVVLDEPAAVQSDSALVDLKLHQMSKSSFADDSDLPVKKLSRSDKNTHQIDKWIENVKELRKMKPPDRVHYSKPMPDIEKLMQEWSPPMEQALKNVTLPTAKLDVPLEEYVDIVLGVADIPVYKNRIQSLHLLFSLYSDLKNNQHFRNIAANSFYGGEEAQTEHNRLEL
uniref:Intraflagellar transport protein 46 homolog n=1 Tax=Ditylenchus dipsaci TaxID=166011 RepID=A0A915EKM6_9BILA